MTVEQLRAVESNGYSELAEQAERRRDGCKFESAEYWRWHEVALFWHWRAEQLQPAGGRTIHPEWFNN